jgi:hypothetical protein
VFQAHIASVAEKATCQLVDLQASSLIECRSYRTKKKSEDVKLGETHLVSDLAKSAANNLTWSARCIVATGANLRICLSWNTSGGMGS